MRTKKDILKTEVMKKVFQNIVDKGYGNCQQAAIASLLGLDLDQVPNFIKYEDPNWKVLQFMEMFGFECSYYDNIRGELIEDKRVEYPTLQEVAKVDGGVDGYFVASVESQSFKGVSHAVIVDSEMNIVHDPNPNQLALFLKPKDIKQIMTCSNNWSIEPNGNISVK